MAGEPVSEERSVGFRAGCPDKRADVALVHSGDTSVLCARDGGSPICSLNETALALWELCDGQTEPGEMVAAICELCDIPPEVAMADVARTFEVLTQNGVLTWRDPR